MISTAYQRNFPVLDLNDQHYLREQTPEDTDAFFEYYADPDVSRYILATIPCTRSEANSEVLYCRNLFYQRKGIYWTIARKSDDQMIGAVGFYINNCHHRAEVCYDLHKDYWRQGIMFKAIDITMHYLFSHMDIHRIEAVTVKENIASIAILKKLGFTLEASLKNYRYFNNRSHDVEMLATTPEIQSQRIFRSQARLLTTHIL